MQIQSEKNVLILSADKSWDSKIDKTQDEKPNNENNKNSLKWTISWKRTLAMARIRNILNENMKI